MSGLQSELNFILSNSISPIKSCDEQNIGAWLILSKIPKFDIFHFNKCLDYTVKALKWTLFYQILSFLSKVVMNRTLVLGRFWVEFQNLTYFILINVWTTVWIELYFIKFHFSYQKLWWIEHWLWNGSRSDFCIKIYTPTIWGDPVEFYAHCVFIVMFHRSDGFQSS